MIDDLLKLGLILCIITGLLEFVLRLTWNTWYFTNGIHLSTKTIKVNYHYSNIPSSLVLEKEFKLGWWLFTNPLLFMGIETDKYAFRTNNTIKAGSPRISHGVVIFDRENSQVTVKSFFDWSVFWFWPIPLIAWSLGGIHKVDILGAIIVFLLIIGTSAWLDYAKCAEIADVAVRLWSRKHIS